VGLEVEVGFGHVAESLSAFHGVGRRFETRGEAGGVRVVDDYGHHPTEIAATLAAARDLGRLLVVFQPHRYSRTALLRREFGAVWGAAARVWVLDVYAAGESPVPGVTGRTVVESARQQGARHVEGAGPEDAVAGVLGEARPGDVVITLGAGDVWKVGDEILAGLRRRAGVTGGARA
jgi:UDP-N-acetylmuramate--alanine ligase